MSRQLSRRILKKPPHCLQLAALCRQSDTRCELVARRGLGWNPQRVVHPRTQQPFTTHEAWTLVASCLGRRSRTQFVKPLPRGLEHEVSFLLFPWRTPVRVQVALGQKVVVGQIFDLVERQTPLNLDGEAHGHH